MELQRLEITARKGPVSCGHMTGVRHTAAATLATCGVHRLWCSLWTGGVAEGPRRGARMLSLGPCILYFLAAVMCIHLDHGPMGKFTQLREECLTEGHRQK
jgi:hypothetical protein